MGKIYVDLHEISSRLNYILDLCGNMKYMLQLTLASFQ